MDDNDAATVRARERFHSWQLKSCRDASTALSQDRTLNFNHQVAGHTSEVLRGFLGKVLKPMVKGHLFVREVRLYEELAEAPLCDHCNHLPRAFVPRYAGLTLVEVRNHGGDGDSRDLSLSSASSPPPLPPPKVPPSLPPSLPGQNGVYALLARWLRMWWITGAGWKGAPVPLPPPASASASASVPPAALLPHLALEDLTRGYCKPCVIDIKMGQQTYEPTASEHKKQREVLKCPYQATTGYRITGMKVFDLRTQTYQCKEKQYGRSLAPGQLCDALSFFFHNGLHLRRDVVLSVVQQLEQILVWLQCQNSLHFYCSSLLIIYDGAPVTDVGGEIGGMPGPRTLPLQAHSTSSATDLVRVKMIDFAHTLPSPGGIDLGYILGLRNLISNLYEVMR